jgi:succinylglutamate desuccinylase
MPNYKNLQSIKKGEKLATDNKGDIKASEDCLILMPLYQAQGHDGFFLVKEVKS